MMEVNKEGPRGGRRNKQENTNGGCDDLSWPRNVVTAEGVSSCLRGSFPPSPCQLSFSWISTRCTQPGNHGQPWASGEPQAQQAH